ncbi:UDP-glucosyltransferase 2-like [Wyeomyia smithii]|uniref:UDP-glucosyltransferase 2-like n=1 Tax=Wyeomyia smithii TaxID=174621 RepID=UPI002467D306|nr:UDP-glucosyltransferase 2-like [Wyeomyia smithii]
MKVGQNLFILFCVLLLLERRGTVGSKILCLHPSPTRSHLMISQALLEGLAERGHQVTMVSSYKMSKPVPNYREVVVPNDDFTSKLARSFLEKPANLWKSMPQLFMNMMNIANRTLNDPEFLALKSEHFDLVIVGLFMPDFVLGLGPHFGAPTVVLFTAGLSSMTADLVGNPLAIAAVPHMVMGKVAHMNFRNRLRNFIIQTAEILTMSIARYYQRQYYEWNFPPDKYPSYDAVLKNVSLVLLNSHFSAGTPRPYLPNVIEVGGLQIKTRTDPLPQEIQQWLDGAEHGAIYFCLGSNLKSADMPEEKLNIIVRTLSRLKQRVLFKWETEELPNQPANVMTKKWLPQSDVLAHKNLVLFVSHGGLGGMAEARYHGVPVLGMPMFAEQSGNVQAAVVEGWAIELDYHKISEESFAHAIGRLLNEPNFNKKAKEISMVFRDRPQSALELACYWVEYVLRYKGSPHMRYQGVDLNFWQLHSLDVISFILAVIYLVWKVTIFVFRRVKLIVCRRNRKQKTN